MFNGYANFKRRISYSDFTSLNTVTDYNILAISAVSTLSIENIYYSISLSGELSSMSEYQYIGSINASY